MATRIKRQSEKKREGHSDNDGTVSFLRLPFLMLLRGGGSAVECGVLHDDTVADNNKYSVLYFVSFVLLTFDKIYILCVVFCKTIQTTAKY